NEHRRSCSPPRGVAVARPPTGRDFQAFALLLYSSPAGISSRFCSRKTSEIPLLGGRATGFSLKTVFARAPGEIIPDKLPFIGLISLFRRGAVPLGTRKLELAQQQARTALRGPLNKAKKNQAKDAVRPPAERAMLRIAMTF
ncbi:MAG: hypothetical protein K2G93_06120, partial [Rikenella sp.]|nr:hypothetical protein [Rikenella sp.]